MNPTDSLETESTEVRTSQTWADSAGLLASVACAIHCAAMPLLIGYLPMLGLSWLADESFHKVMALVCFGLAALAFLPGWRRHGSLAPVLVGSTGVILLAVAAFGLECEGCASCAATCQAVAEEPACSDTECTHCVAVEPEPATVKEPALASAGWLTPLVTPLGGVLLVAGHLTNHRKCCACCRSRCPHDGEASAEA